MDAAELVRAAVGLEDQHAFLSRHMPLLPLYEKVNTELPADSRVMLSCYCGGFHLDRTTYCADMVQGSLRLATWDSFLTDVRRLGVTHVIAPVVLATGGPPPSVDRASIGYAVREEEHARVGELLVRYGRLLGSADGQGLYALDFPDVTRSSPTRPR
jgi:hypothetical protein